MKTVIEMAREAGGALSCIAEPLEHPWKFSQAELERFAALIREEEANKWKKDLREAIEAQGFCYACAKSLDEADAQQNHSEQDLNMVQEPVAWRWKTHNGYAYSEEHYEGEGGEPLYTTPPTYASLAAQAARQMRDFVFTALLAAETPYTQMTMMQKKVFGDAIASLPVPEVQWQNIHRYILRRKSTLGLKGEHE